MMAGMIATSAGDAWTAASWLFDWVLTTIAEESRDSELTAELTLIVRENLGSLSLKELPVDQRREFVQVAAVSLIPVAEATWRSEMPGRDDAVNHLQHLVEMLRSTPD
jgi:hypothetical protein